MIPIVHSQNKERPLLSSQVKEIRPPIVAIWHDKKYILLENNHHYLFYHLGNETNLLGPYISIENIINAFLSMEAQVFQMKSWEEFAKWVLK